MIIRPNGAPGTRKTEALDRHDVKRIVEFQEWCERHGLALDIYCKKCTEDGRGRCWGNNDRWAPTWKLECHCTERVYGRDVVIPPKPEPEKKIQVVV